MITSLFHNTCITNFATLLVARRDQKSPLITHVMSLGSSGKRFRKNVQHARLVLVWYWGMAFINYSIRMNTSLVKESQKWLTLVVLIVMCRFLTLATSPLKIAGLAIPSQNTWLVKIAEAFGKKTCDCNVPFRYFVTTPPPENRGLSPFPVKTRDWWKSRKCLGKRHVIVMYRFVTS